MMDHHVAEKTGAVERYLLNEVTPEERAEFEAHFFDCTVCSDKVREGAIFIDNAKEVLRFPLAQTEAKRNSKSWFAWLRPAVLVPAMAILALAIVVGYQNFITLPQLRQPQVLSTFVIAPLAREEAPVIDIDPRLPRFNLNFMVDSARVYPDYLCEFQDGSGHQILSVSSGPRDVSAFTLSFLLRTSQFPDGRYELIVHPADELSAVVQRYAFVIRRKTSK